MTRRNKAVLDVELFAQPIEHVRATGLFTAAFGSKTVGELAAVVGEQLDELDGASLVDPGQEIDTAAVGLIGIQFNENPARGAVDGDEQVAHCRLVWHLGQVLDVDVHKTRLVVLEGFLRGRRAAFLLDQVTQVRDAMAPQAPPQAGARDGRIDEFTRHRQQVIRWQQQCLAQLDHDEFLLGRERRVHLVRAVRFVFAAIAVLPLPDGLPGDVVQPCQLGLGKRGVADFLADQMGRTCLAVQSLGNEVSRW
jgi:hypothetical protein